MNRAKELAGRLFRRCWRPIHRTLVPRLIRGGYSPGPRELLIQLTYKCNLRCSFCGQWGDTGTFKQLPGSELRQALPLAVLKRVIDELPFSCGRVFLWGGETLEYPDIAPLIRHIKDSGRSADLVTNGTFLAKQARGLVYAGVDAVAVSLDGGEETHDRLRGLRGTFRAAIDGIRALHSERSARQSRKPIISVSAVIVPEAAAELPDLVRQLRMEGADQFSISRLQHTTEQQGKAHEKVFQELFQITPGSWKGFLRSPAPGSAEKVKAAVEELCADPANKNFVVWEPPSWTPQDFLNYYADPKFAAPAGRACRYPWDSVCVYPNGDLSPCPDYPDFVVGNVNESSFSKIWNGERFVHFRKKLAEQGRFPICTSCCHLYGR